MDKRPNVGDIIAIKHRPGKRYVVVRSELRTSDAYDGVYAFSEIDVVLLHLCPGEDVEDVTSFYINDTRTVQSFYFSLDGKGKQLDLSDVTLRGTSKLKTTVRVEYEGTKVKAMYPRFGMLLNSTDSHDLISPPTVGKGRITSNMKRKP